MTYAGKVWGGTELLLQTPLVEVHRIRVLPHRHCSWHVHRTKWNAFYVVKGSLFIQVEKDYQLTDESHLMPGMTTTVKPGEYHRFVTRSEDCVALEMYYPEVLGADIVRRDHGGRDDEEKV